MGSKKPHQSTDAPLLRERAEELLRANPSDVPMMPTADVQALVHELSVHHMELEIQNEELRIAQGQLAETRDCYADLYEFAPVGYLSLSRDGVIRQANLTSAKLLDQERSALIGQKLSKFVARESQDHLHSCWHEVLESGNHADCELHFSGPNEASLAVQLDMVVHAVESPSDDTSATADIRVTITDITRRKRAEEALRLLNEELEERVVDQTGEIRLQAEAIANLGEGVIITNDHLDWPGPPMIFVNDAMCRITGYTADELIGKSPSILLGERSDRETLDRIHAELAAGRSCAAELVNYRKDGTTYDTDLFVTPLFDADGRTNFVSVHRDISERKRAERDRRKAESDAEFLNGIHYVLTDGRNPKEMIRHILQALREHLDVDEVIFAYLPEDGGRRPSMPGTHDLSDYLSDAEREAMLAGVTLVINDVSDLPHTPTQIESFRRKQIGAFLSGPLATDAGVKACVVANSQQARQWQPDEVQMLRRVTERLFPAVQRARAEAALRESERAHVTLINNLPGAAYRCENDRKWTAHYLSDGISQLTGYPAKEFLDGRLHVGDLVHLDDREQVWGKVQNAISERQPFQLVYRLISRDNKTLTIWEQGQGVFSDEGELLALEGYMADITELKQAERALQGLYEFNENLFATAQNIILVLDPDGCVLRFNPAFEQLSGWSVSEAEGCDWFETFVPTRDRQRIRELFAKAVSGIQTHGTVNPILTKKGEERMIEWHNAVLEGSEGEFLGILCTGMDVTDRLRLEQEVINASEEERRTIAQDLHDDLGSLLTGIDFRVKGLAMGIAKRWEHEKLIENSQEIQTLIQDAIRKTRSISKGLHAVGTHPEDLMNALKDLVVRVKEGSRMRCLLRCPEPVLVYDTNIANHLFRIAQEAANNAIKHSEGSQITIFLSESDGQISLRITDDGKGITCTDHGATGLGLHTMKYRASAIGGYLTIGQRRGGGTKVECRIPVRR